MTDRRAHLRFQVVGATGASFVTSERLRMVNVGLSGALVHAPFPLTTNAEFRMQLVMSGHVSDATVKIRRVTPIGAGSTTARYQVGLEFLALSSEAEDAIGRLVSPDEAVHLMVGGQPHAGVMERRRSPRGAVDETSLLAMRVAWRVQVLDMSHSGVAFTFPYAVEVGRTASVQATLGRDAFSAQIRVCWSRPRVAGSSGNGEFEIGAVFLSLSDCSRRALCAFLKCSPSV